MTIKTVLAPGAPWPTTPTPYKRKKRFLSAIQAEELRELHAAGVCRKQLQLKFGVSYDTITHVLMRRNAYSVP